MVAALGLNRDAKIDPITPFHVLTVHSPPPPLLFLFIPYFPPTSLSLHTHTHTQKEKAKRRGENKDEEEDGEEKEKERDTQRDTDREIRSAYILPCSPLLLASQLCPTRKNKNVTFRRSKPLSNPPTPYAHRPLPFRIHPKVHPVVREACNI